MRGFFTKLKSDTLNSGKLDDDQEKKSPNMMQSGELNQVDQEIQEVQNKFRDFTQ